MLRKIHCQEVVRVSSFSMGIMAGIPFTLCCTDRRDIGGTLKKVGELLKTDYPLPTKLYYQKLNVSFLNFALVISSST